MMHAALDRPRSEALDLNSVADTDSPFLVPAERPVGRCGLIEEYGAHRSAFGAKHRGRNGTRGREQRPQGRIACDPNARAVPGQAFHRGAQRGEKIPGCAKKAFRAILGVEKRFGWPRVHRDVCDQQPPRRQADWRAGSPKMQMGPASLPTPLSPTRGQARRHALGARCFAVILHRSAEFRVCHRRSHRHPDPPSGGFLVGDRGRSRLFPRIPHPQWAVPRSDIANRFLERLRLLRSEDLPKRLLGTDRTIRPVTGYQLASIIASLASGRSHQREVTPDASGQILPRHPGLEFVQRLPVVRPSIPVGFRPVPMT